jgi:hypothetical protein
MKKMNFKIIKRTRMVTLWIIFISFAHLHSGNWFWPDAKKESKIIKAGLQEAGSLAAGTVATGLIAHGESIKTAAEEMGANIEGLKETIQSGSEAIAHGLEANAHAVVLTAAITGIGWLVYKAQPHVWPTVHQKNDQLRAKNEYETQLSQTMFIDCVHKNATCPDNEMGFPAACSIDARAFIAKAGEAHFKNILKDHSMKF